MGHDPSAVTHLMHELRLLVIRTERTPNQSQQAVEELLRLRLLAAPQERDRQGFRQEQRVFVLCAEQAGRLDEDLALDLRGLGVLTLS